MQLSGVVAVEVTGGPTIEFIPGRKVCSLLGFSSPPCKFGDLTVVFACFNKTPKWISGASNNAKIYDFMT